MFPATSDINAMLIFLIFTGSSAMILLLSANNLSQVPVYRGNLKQPFTCSQWKVFTVGINEKHPDFIQLPEIVFYTIREFLNFLSTGTDEHLN